MSMPDDEDEDDFDAARGSVNDAYRLEENEDGSATISFDESPSTYERDPEHFGNLAHGVSRSERQALGIELCEMIERDAESWKERDRLYAEGIMRSGVAGPAPGGANFDGASRVTHPMILEAQVDFSARAMKELVPPDGPVKDKVMGEQTRRKLDRAQRKTRYMNWQLMHLVVGYRDSMKQMLMQLGDSGSQFTLWGWDDEKRRPTFEFVPANDIIIPFSATSWWTSHRKTHRIRMTEFEFGRRVASGQYIDPGTSPPMTPTKDDAQKAQDKALGREDDAYNQDGVRTLYNVYVMRDEEREGEVLPYLYTVDVYAKEVIAIHRNWDPSDDDREEIFWITDWTFLHWMGPYGIGLPHVIGGLSAAATGALRALLDSGLINTMPAALKLKGATRGGQSVQVEPVGIMEIEGGPAADDIRKLAMPFPFNPPSPSLFQLLGFIVDAGRGVVRTVLEETAESNQNVPVGTTLARIEQGMAVFSDIHAGLHYAMARSLKTLHTINRLFMDDEVVVHELGELIVTRRDFQGPIDVIPVSDPNIFSDAQRTAQAQIVAQRSDGHPGLYDPRKVEEFLLDRLKMPFAKDLLAKPPEPQFLNAVNENLSATASRPIIAFPEQDHLAHLQVHASFMASKALGSLPTIAPKFIPLMLEHLNQHLTFFYVTTVHAYASEAAGRDIAEMIPKREDVASNRAYDQLLAAATIRAMPDIERALSGVLPVIQQAMGLMGQLQQNQGLDGPTQLALAQLRERTEAVKQGNVIRMEDAKQRSEAAARRDELERAKLEAAQRREHGRLQADVLGEQSRQEADLVKTESNAQNAERQREHEAALEAQRNASELERDRLRAAQEAADAELELRRERQRAIVEAARGAAKDRADAERQAATDASRAAVARETSASRERMNEADNRTAVEIAEMEVESAEKVQVSTGTGIGEG